MPTDASDVPDIYCDGVQIAMTPYDVLLMLTQNKPALGATSPQAHQIQVQPQPVGLVRMSLEHAKVLTMLLKRNLRAYEDKADASIPLDPDTSRRLGISKEEDW